ncbi:uncharacterized protein [Typha latifolia]|uniref:uncharacterized protein n=1 Tax=Typha latifolia TaxID=4733 RepID=UPI003C2F15F1
MKQEIRTEWSLPISDCLSIIGGEKVIDRFESYKRKKLEERREFSTTSKRTPLGFLKENIGGGGVDDLVKPVDQAVLNQPEPLIKWDVYLAVGVVLSLVCFCLGTSSYGRTMKAPGRVYNV